MGKLYVDIIPCRECQKVYMLGGCSIRHLTFYIDGCKKCGTEVNWEWYYKDKKCPDFEQRYYSDPSGS